MFLKLYDLTYVVRSKRGLEMKTTIFNDFLCFLICAGQAVLLMYSSSLILLLFVPFFSSVFNAHVFVMLLSIFYASFYVSKNVFLK